MNSNAQLTLTITTDQARALNLALEVFTRLGIGQIEHLAELVSTGIIPAHEHARALADAPITTGKRIIASDGQCAQTQQLCRQIKVLLGYPVNGSYGIGSPHVEKSVHRAYEIRKVLSKALAEHQTPAPSSGFRGVDYDGLLVRYTTDPEPKAVIQP